MDNRFFERPILNSPYAPVFFSQDEWVSPPDDWAKTGIQQGEAYQLDSGEGQRVLEECLERAQTGARYWNVDVDSIP